MSAITQTFSKATSTLSSAASTTSAPSLPSDSSSAKPPSSSRPPQVHTVKAGSGGFKFDPPELNHVNPGDTVTFEFYPLDHSVARAEFGSACVPYEYTGKGKEGFWSDTQNVADVQHLQYYNITINSTEPIFYYCAAPDSCTGQHMVGVINPNSTQTLEKQKAAAEEATFQVRPGDPIPAEGTATLGNSASASPTTSPTGSPTSAPPPSTPHSHGLSTGAAAGIGVGAAAFLVLCALLFFYVGRTKSLKEAIKHRNAGFKPPPSSPGYPPTAHFSPSMHPVEAGGAGQMLPAYGQHNATDSWYGGFPTPGHTPLASPPILLARGSAHGGLQPMVEAAKQVYPSELASSQAPGQAPERQQAFAQTHELEAPIKAAR